MSDLPELEDFEDLPDDGDMLQGEMPEVDAPPVTSEDALEKIVKMQQQMQAQIVHTLQQIAQRQMQDSQALAQAIQNLAQTNQQLARALSGPRRRTPVRNSAGDIVETRDEAL